MTDEFGTVDIPDQFSYWFVLTEMAIIIKTSRRDEMTKTVNVIQINSLQEQTQHGTTYKGGIEDMMEFKEGFCFVLNQMTSATRLDKWILCTDTLKAKKMWMT